jgi:hypothetical protein
MRRPISPPLTQWSMPSPTCLAHDAYPLRIFANGDAGVDLKIPLESSTFTFRSTHSGQRTRNQQSIPNSASSARNVNFIRAATCGESKVLITSTIRRLNSCPEPLADTWRELLARHKSTWEGRWRFPPSKSKLTHRVMRRSIEDAD